MSIGESHRPLRDTVLDELRGRILDRRLPPGTRLTETFTSELLGVSRLPVREAFRRLESEGLVEALPRRGVRVVERPVHELATIHEIRVNLELMAVRRAAARHDAETVAALERLLADGAAAAADGDRAALERLNGEFHDVLARGSGSRVLADVLRWVRNQSHHLAGGWVSPADLSWEEHASIVRAVLAEDAEMASLLMRRHLEARHAVQAAAVS
ncbi:MULTISPECIES: GntR family transcriptional regulator [unclassified Pseudofrankia]|uniref:GntR family transcriptional regulator n=1 Tax=unclassified Pseudofrankia TaxID=2994372 RepID=UPI0008D918DD|nr:MULTISPECIES: GntR family transcriptional regulator [unclassified Pseudofrankia]MDT3438218.1 GntR family transcriptional regulator [Pseudofrankia sp. BMG5.37]OHV46557.1 hypothetical protein BCD48_20765 [Pseudofrankia sp. BMG5.36]